MSKPADLHIHSYYSDGTSSPEEIVEQALQADLSCIAVTDHDTIGGIALTMDSACGHDLEVLSGIELSSHIHNRDVHVLGYLFDYKNRDLVQTLTAMQDSRQERMKKMVEKLKELGVTNIELADVDSKAQSDSIGRPHLAAVLVDKGKVSSIKEAFDKYLAEGAPAYMSKFKYTPFEAIDIIKKAGGLAVLAHPMLTQIDELIPQLVKAGLDGLEVYYPYTSENMVHFYEGLALKHNLLLTGGSDAHGTVKKHTHIGRIRISYDLVEKMKHRQKEQF